MISGNQTAVYPCNAKRQIKSTSSTPLNRESNPPNRSQACRLNINALGKIGVLVTQMKSVKSDKSCQGSISEIGLLLGSIKRQPLLTIATSG